MIGYHLKEYNR